MLVYMKDLMSSGIMQFNVHNKATTFICSKYK